MSIVASQLVAEVSVNGADTAQQQLKNVGESVDQTGGLMKTAFVGVAETVGKDLVGLGEQSLHMAADFESGITSLATGAGEAQSNLKMVGEGILNTATLTGDTTQQLLSAEYLIESAGQHGQQSLATLQDVAEGAKVGVASLADVANGVTTEMTDYASSNLTAAQATNDLIATVADGKTHMGDLSRAMSTILPTASAMRVGLYDVSGAMATMTGEGTGAAQSATYLRQLLTALENPAKKGADALHAIGLTSTEVSTEMRKSLPDALQMITDALGKKFPVGSAAYMKALSDIAGGSKQMQGILELTGDHLKVFQGNVAGITDAVHKGGNSIVGWSEVQGDFNTKLDQAKEVVETLGIKVGTALLPVVGKLFDTVSPLITQLSHWLDTSGALQRVTDGLSLAIKQVSTAFDAVYAPIQHVQQAAAPLLDSFDRATAIIPRSTQVMKPLLDSFDRATGIFHSTQAAARPLLDSFDRATAIIPHLTATTQHATDTFNPFVDIFKELQPMVSDVVDILKSLDDIVMTVVTDGARFTDGLLDAANKSGMLQDVLKSIKNILPEVSDFLKKAGDDINTDLLPPLEHLVTNVGEAIGKFATWLDKSGAAKTALSDLGNVIGTTTHLLGPLIDVVAKLVGWLGGGGAGTTTLVVVLGTLATAFVALKIADTVSQFSQMFSKLQSGDGIVSNLADSFKNKLSSSVDDFLSKQAPNLKKSLDDIKTKSDDAGKSVSTMGDESEVAGEKVSSMGTKTEVSAGEVTALGTDAEATSGEVSTMGADAQVASGEVSSLGTDSVVASGEIVSLGTDAETTSAEVTVLGTDAEVAGTEITAMGAESAAAGAEVSSLGAESAAAEGGIGGLLGKMGGAFGIIGAGGGTGTSHDWSGKPVQVTGWASGGTNIPEGDYKVGEEGEELMHVPGGSTIYNHSQTMNMLSSGGGGNGPIIIPICIGSDEIATYMVDPVMRTVMRTTNRKSGRRGL